MTRYFRSYLALSCFMKYSWYSATSTCMFDFNLDAKPVPGIALSGHWNLITAPFMYQCHVTRVAQSHWCKLQNHVVQKHHGSDEGGSSGIENLFICKWYIFYFNYWNFFFLISGIWWIVLRWRKNSFSHMIFDYSGVTGKKLFVGCLFCFLLF